MCLCMNMCLYSPEFDVRSCLQSFFTYFETTSHWSWSFLIDQQDPGLFLSLPGQCCSFRLIQLCQGFFTWVLGNELRFSCLHTIYLTYWTISQAVCSDLTPRFPNLFYPIIAKCLTVIIKHWLHIQRKPCGVFGCWWRHFKENLLLCLWKYKLSKGSE